MSEVLRLVSRRKQAGKWKGKTEKGGGGVKGGEPSSPQPPSFFSPLPPRFTPATQATDWPGQITTVRHEIFAGSINFREFHGFSDPRKLDPAKVNSCEKNSAKIYSIYAGAHHPDLC